MLFEERSGRRVRSTVFRPQMDESLQAGVLARHSNSLYRDDLLHLSEVSFAWSGSSMV